MATLSSTTLNGAVTATAPSLYLTSATGVDVGTVLFCEREAMRVSAIDGTKATVQRGWGGSRVSAHPTLATVYHGTADQFYQANPAGAIAAADIQVTPWINITTGQIWTAASGTWVESVEIDLSGGTDPIAGTLPAASGGTGHASYAVGDLLYASGATALSKLAGVGTGSALISGGVATAPAWGKVGLTTHISGTLAETNGGTGSTSLEGARIPIAKRGWFIKSTTGAQTLLPSAAPVRVVLIFVVVTEVFAAGDGTETVFTIGEEDTPAKFAASATFTGAAAGTVFTFMGELASTKACTATFTAATGTGTGAVRIAVFAVPT